MRAFVLAGVLSLGLVFNCFAAKEAAAPNPEPQKQETKTIFSFKDQIGLSDKQVENIKALLADLQKNMMEKSKALNALRDQLSEMLQNKDAMKVIRSKLQQIADLQVEASYSDIEISRKVEDIMTPAQLKKWKDIQAKARDEMMKAMGTYTAPAPTKPKS